MLPLLLLLAQAQVPTAPRAPHAAQSLVRDAWSPTVTWRSPSGGFVAAIHSTLLPDGRVLFIGNERPVKTPGWSGGTTPFVWTQTMPAPGATVPANVQVTKLSVPVVMSGQVFGGVKYVDTLYCAGHAPLADGTLFVAGGTRVATELSSGQQQRWGLGYGMLFDGAWTRVREFMVGSGSIAEPARWYPACTRLADGRVLVTAGIDQVSPTKLPNLSVELFDPQAEDWTLLSPHASSPPEIFNPDYTHPFVLPAPIAGHELLMFGEPGVPVLFSLAGGWLVRANPRPGEPHNEPNHGASTALLPLRIADGEWGYANGSVLIAGGHHDTSYQSTADVYDPYADAWVASAELGTPRHHPATVLLPDGRVLVITGHAHNSAQGTRRATYVDPSNGFEARTGLASAGMVRGYHTVALLLPDGRVMVGGGRDNYANGTGEKAHFQLYYPTYWFEPRPTIVAAPHAMTYGGSYTVTTEGAPAAEVVLIGLGSMTHSFDMNQRHVELARTATSGSDVTVTAPPNASLAPPGHYMLFALDAQRRPSRARLVHLQ